MAKRKVVVLTDGDWVAEKVVEQVAKNIGGRAISISGGNPTRSTGPEIVAAVKQTPYDPVLVMIDDCGFRGKGRGEQVLEELMHDQEIEVLGVVAVASNTIAVEGTPVNFSVTREGEVVERAVDKDGHPKPNEHKVHGDTVDIIGRLQIPLVVGLGDLGKMEDADRADLGAKVTTQAVREILKRSNYYSLSE